MRNLEVAELLYNISELLEIKGENPFKVGAYAKAARAIEAFVVLPSVKDAIKMEIV